MLGWEERRMGEDGAAVAAAVAAGRLVALLRKTLFARSTNTSVSSSSGGQRQKSTGPTQERAVLAAAGVVDGAVQGRLGLELDGADVRRNRPHRRVDHLPVPAGGRASPDAATTRDVAADGTRRDLRARVDPDHPPRALL